MDPLQRGGHTATPPRDSAPPTGFGGCGPRQAGKIGPALASMLSALAEAGQADAGCGSPLASVPTQRSEETASNVVQPGTDVRAGRLRLARTDKPVLAARRYTSQTLEQWHVPPELADDALLIVSELVTNAEEHAAGTGGPQEIHLTLGSHRLLIAVSDGNPRRPVLREADTDDEFGRGLAIIHALAQDHGYCTGEHHKTVWAELAA